MKWFGFYRFRDSIRKTHGFVVHVFGKRFVWETYYR